MVEPRGRIEGTGPSGCGGAMARTESGSLDLNSERRQAKDAAAGKSLYPSDAAMAQIADQNAEILEGVRLAA